MQSTLGRVRTRPRVIRYTISFEWLIVNPYAQRIKKNVFLGEKRDPSERHANANLRNQTHITQKPSYVYLLTGYVCGQYSDHNPKKRICNVRTRSLWYVEIVVCRLHHTSSFRETSF